MRRNDREIADQRMIEDLLATGEVCRLAMVDDGVPYVVPVNYGYRDRVLYVHCAPSGRKIDILHRNPLVCFEIETESTIVRHAEPCRWGTRARSLIGYGRVEIVTDHAQKKRGLDILMAHHGKTDANDYGEKQLNAVVVLKIPIDSVQCKQVGDWE